MSASISPCSDAAAEYFDRVADAMVILYGISHGDAVGVINAAVERTQKNIAAMKAEADADTGSRAARAGQRMRRLGIEIGEFDLTSDSLLDKIMRELPEYWARCLYTGKGSREPISGWPVTE